MAGRRVSRQGVLIKDHFRDGLLAGPTLRFMDWVGNAPHGVRLPYNYLTRAEWQSLFAATGLRIERWDDELGLYAPPLSLAFDRKLHVLATVAHAA